MLATTFCLSEDVHSPIAGLKSADGVRGSQQKQRDGYAEKIHEVAEATHARMMAGATVAS